MSFPANREGSNGTLCREGEDPRCPTERADLFDVVMPFTYACNEWPNEIAVF